VQTRRRKRHSPLHGAAMLLEPLDLPLDMLNALQHRLTSLIINPLLQLPITSPFLIQYTSFSCLVLKSMDRQLEGSSSGGRSVEDDVAVGGRVDARSPPEGEVQCRR
jgi:hypothetical protein